MNIFQQVFASVDPKSSQLVKASENHNDNTQVKKEKDNGLSANHSLNRNNQAKSTTAKINVQSKPKIEYKKPEQKTQPVTAPKSTKASTIHSTKSTRPNTNSNVISNPVANTSSNPTQSNHPENNNPIQINNKNKENDCDNNENQKIIINESDDMKSHTNKTRLAKGKRHPFTKEKENELRTKPEDSLADLEKKYDELNDKLQTLSEMYDKAQSQNEKITAKNFELELEIQKMKEAAKVSNNRLIDLRQEYEAKAAEREESWEFRVNELLMEIEVLKSTA
ncbi:hypothetical protein TRFO_31548 [Tritrichomonas foetus]|uniref:Uncharacterized protein n=1 Tax=Tritrichomonas foetus TaxID=1144522 RepID=A0A1J4JR30_9EUKA|nr:hypothetical protein TRFO_31548 [Tritrichomonas foetus]|eukprot:OHT01569.1 hypothetical protein TRFO_31548 [Tritrichomonas foetus]